MTMRWLGLWRRDQHTNGGSRVRGRRLVLALEQLEARLAPAASVVLTYGGLGTPLTLTETTAGANSITISDSGNHFLTIDLGSSATFAASSSPGSLSLIYDNGPPQNSHTALISTGTIDSISALTASLPGDTLTFAQIGNQDGGLDNISASASVIQVTGPVDTTKISTASGGNVRLEAAQNVLVQPDGTVNTTAGITTRDGNITILANQGTVPVAGNFVGIDVSGATLKTTGAGSITLQGRGGDDATTGGHHGINIHQAALVQSAGSGTISLVGIGGAGTNNNDGVLITDSSTTVTSVTGDITLQGTGGVGSDAFNIGVLVFSGGQVTSTGTGAHAARLTVEGTGGTGTSANYGVDVQGAQALLTSVDGAVSISGSGGQGHAILMDGASISATGVGAITLTATQDVEIQDQASITAVDGALTILANQGAVPALGSFTGIDLSDATVETTGAGAILLEGRGGDAPTRDFLEGMSIQLDALVESAGTGSITLIGTGGQGDSSDTGIELTLSSLVTSVVGNITLTGTGGTGSFGLNDGIDVLNGAQISSTGVGTDAARITLTGTGGTGDQQCHGVFFSGIVDSRPAGLTSVVGDITVRGIGGQGSGFFDTGVYLSSYATITSTGTGANGARITLDGTGGPGTDGNRGLLLQFKSLVSSVTGDIALSGTGGQGSGTGNTGVDMSFNTVKSQDGSIQVSGNAGTGSSSHGISLDTSAVLTTGVGAITLSTPQDIRLSSSTVTAVDGAVTLLANEGVAPAAGDFTGIDINSSTVKTTGAGPILLRGRGASNPDTGSQVGILVQMGGTVTSAGTGSLTLDGTGGAGPDNNVGVQIQDMSTLVTSATGPLVIRGSGGSGTDSFNIGVAIESGAEVTSTGTTAGAAPITISGSGGTGTQDNYGVFLKTALVTTVAGDITITGTGGNGTQSNNDGILMSPGQVTSTGAARLTLTGSGGSGTASHGIDLEGSGASISAQGGDVQLTGTAGSGSGSHALLVNGASVSTTGAGSVTLSAIQDVVLKGGASLTAADGALTVLANQGTVPAAGNFVGIDITGTTVKTTGAGAITLRGRGGDDPATGGHHGIAIHQAATVQSAGTGSVTVVGVTGEGTSNDFGVFLGDKGSALTSVAGAISITGTGGQGSGFQNIGVLVLAGAQVSSTGTGAGAAPITIDGSGGAGGSDTYTGNYGVDVEATQASVTAVDGAIVIRGSGGQGAGTTNTGIHLAFSGQVSATGSGSVTLVGSGGSGTGGDHGIDLEGSDVSVSAQGGNVLLSGSAGTGSGSHALLVNGASVSTTGAGSVTLSATQDVVLMGGASVTAADGVLAVLANQGTVPAAGNFVGIDITGTTVKTTGAGAITLRGRGGDDPATGSHHGVAIHAAATVQSAGTGSVTVVGVTGEGTSNDFGVFLGDKGSTVTSVTGAISITGTGGQGSGFQNIGVLVLSGAQVSSTGTGVGVGGVTLVGLGGTGTSSNYGVDVAAALVTAVDGAVVIRGSGGQGSMDTNTGIHLSSGGQASATGTGSVTLVGSGGTGTGIDQGIDLEGSDVSVSAQGGVVLLTGSAGSGSGSHALLVNGASVSTSGAGSVTLSAAQDVVLLGGAQVTAADGALTVLANQGTVPAVGNFVGIDITGTTVKTTGAGAITLRGRGGDDPATGGHHGVAIHQAATVQSAGTGTVTVVGVAGVGTSNNFGVFLGDAGSAVTSVSGAISITGTGGQGSGFQNMGVLVLAGAQVSSTGTGVGAGGVTLVGLGGTGTSSNYGVDVAVAQVTAVDGKVAITGTAGQGTSGDNSGIHLSSGAQVSATGAGSVTLTGTGGSGTDGDHGVDVQGTGTLVTSATGAVVLLGTAGAGAGSAALSLGTGGQVAAASGPITLTGDSMLFDATAVINGGTSLVTLQPLTPGTAIDLGGPDVPGTLGLSAVEVNDVRAGVLRIGSHTTGTITVSAAITPAGSATLSLLNNGAITETGSLNPTNLLIDSPGPVTLTQANGAGVLAARVGAGPFSFAGGALLRVGTVAGVAGISAGGNVTLTVAGTLTLGSGAGEGISVPGGIVDLAATTVMEAAGSTITAAALRLSGSGSFTLDQSNAIATLAAATGPLTFTDGADLTLDVVRGTAGIQAGSNPVSLTAGGNLTLLQSIQASAVTLTAGASIQGSANVGVVAATLAIPAAVGIGSAAVPLVTAVGTVAASVGGGGIFLANHGPLTIGAVGLLDGLSATGGPISVSATGPLTVSGDVQAPGDITLTAAPAVPPLPGADLTVTPGVTVRSSAGGVTLAAGDDLTLQAGSQAQAAASLILFAGFQGTGSNLTIAGTAAGTSVNVQGGAGDDTLLIDFTGGASLPNGLSFHGGGGHNTLAVSDQGGSAAHSYLLNPGGVTRDGAAALAFDGATVQGVTVTGGDNRFGDSFALTPSATTAFFLHGGLPTPPANPGDSLSLDLTDVLGAALSATSGASGYQGMWTFDNRQPVHFDGIETLAPTADLALSLTPGTSSAVVGDLLMYNVTVSNNGPSNTATIVTLRLQGLQFVSSNVHQGTVSSSGDVVTWDLGSLASTAAVRGTLTFRAVGVGAGGLTASVSGAAPDLVPGNNTQSADVLVTADMMTGGTMTDGTMMGSGGAVLHTLEGTPLPADSVLAAFSVGSNVLPGSAFQATIDWGDGTSSVGTVVASGAGYVVQGGHTYDNEGMYAITVHVGSASYGTMAVVSEPLPPGARGTAEERFVAEVFHDLLGQAVGLADLQRLATPSLNTPAGRRLLLKRLMHKAPFAAQYRALRAQLLALGGSPRTSPVNLAGVLIRRLLDREPDAATVTLVLRHLHRHGQVDDAITALVISQDYFQKATL